MEKKKAACTLCGNACVLNATIEDGKITCVERADDPFLATDICVKGAALKQYVHNPNRIEHPMKRVGEGDEAHYEQISWDQAISEIAERLLKTRDESGAKATVFFGGHPKWYRRPLAELAAVYGSPNYCTESSTCHSAASIAWTLTCGASMPQPDIKNSDVHIIWSANPAANTGVMKPLMGFKKRGGKLIVVDPHVTGTANMADLHLQLTPGTDGALALAIANVIIANGLENKEYIEKYTKGYAEYKKYVSEFTPERAQEITGVSAEDIEKAAMMIAGKKVSIRTSSCAIVHGPNGVQNLRAVACILALNGNFETEGGNRTGIVKKMLVDNFHHASVDRPSITDDMAAGAYPVWNRIIVNEAQCARLADVILEEKPYKVRNLIGFGMNLGMWPRPDKMLEAIRKVEFSVITDLFWTDAAKNATYVLPACAGPERDQVIDDGKAHLEYVSRVVDPGDKLTDPEIMMRLADAMDLKGDIISRGDYQGFLDYTLRKLNITARELKERGSIDIEPWSIRPFDLAKDFKTPSGKVEFVSGIMEEYGEEALPIYHDFREELKEEMKAFPYILAAGPRRAWYFHSRTNRVNWLGALEDRTLVSVSNIDAEKLGIVDGSKVCVSTPVGSMVYTAWVDHGIKEGVVYIFHDGIDDNINLIIDDHYTDRISGFPGFRSYICKLEVEK